MALRTVVQKRLPEDEVMKSPISMDLLEHCEDSHRVLEKGYYVDVIRTLTPYTYHGSNY